VRDTARGPVFAGRSTVGLPVASPDPRAAAGGPAGRAWCGEAPRSASTPLRLPPWRYPDDHIHTKIHTEVSLRGDPMPTTRPSTLPGPRSADTHDVRQELPIPAHALPHRTPRELVTLARRGLEEAAETRTDGLRYATAHLAALRAAAAVLTARARPAPGRRRRLTPVWSLLFMAPPEPGEPASFL